MELVNAAEIARRLKVSRVMVYKYINQSHFGFPEPTLYYNDNVPLWDWPVVDKWSSLSE